MLTKNFKSKNNKSKTERSKTIGNYYRKSLNTDKITVYKFDNSGKKFDYKDLSKIILELKK